MIAQRLVDREGDDGGRGQGRTIGNAFIFFDPFIKFIIMLRIDTMISVVYCRLSGHNVDDRLSRARTFCALRSSCTKMRIRNPAAG